MNAMLGMIHNAMLIAQTEKTINKCLKNGMDIYLKNPDGTRIKLQEGMRFITMEIHTEPKELSEVSLTRLPQSWCYVEELGNG